MQNFVAALNGNTDVDINSRDGKTGEALLHSLIKMKRSDRIELVLALLINSDVDIHLKTSHGMAAAAPIHLAVEVSSCKHNNHYSYYHICIKYTVNLAIIIINIT